ncbi:thiamine-phosphate synthase family protein [Pyrobaculum calidifontis]|uniref:Thiamine-phosphate synthase ThiN domain-containing protein n=1 Tax=Pyrobaculum calidifontis (strain DSM 21063 / JCM 11548 / VA1) TaxID=410359 RepID=A3MUP9_PYRCJ|nr:thiamine-phosphate synthase family protein [Pyrobaculum calidifontis]ABO08366.1 conserved hypothetical protein [Pyrobaculum calidifontis JCM 11548]
MLPIEFIVEVFVTPLKGVLAHELAERGFSQSRIGQLLGISQPAVSAYLKTPRAQYEEKLMRVVDRRQLQSLVRSAAALAESSPAEEVLRYIDNYALSLLSSLRLCHLHRSMYPLSPTCDICKDISVHTEAVKRVETALAILQNCGNCHKLVPKVLMNIVELGPEGSVGFPGRIFVEGTRLVARERPRPGASRFLGRLVEEINAIHGEVRAAANIAYVAKDCVAKTMAVAEVGPSNSEDEIVENIKAAFKSGIYDVVYDTGGRGIEPNAYVFGTDAVDVASKILEVAKCLS